MGFWKGVVEFLDIAVNEAIDSTVKNNDRQFKGTSRQSEWASKRSSIIETNKRIHDRMQGFADKVGKWEDK